MNKQFEFPYTCMECGKGGLIWCQLGQTHKILGFFFGLSGKKWNPGGNNFAANCLAIFIWAYSGWKVKSFANLGLITGGISFCFSSLRGEEDLCLILDDEFCVWF